MLVGLGQEKAPLAEIGMSNRRKGFPTY